MVHIKATSKRGKELITRYNNSTETSIYHCYVNPSQSKRIAEYNCKAIMVDTGGRDYRILGYNAMQFTCGWKTSTGLLRVETAYNTYIIY